MNSSSWLYLTLNSVKYSLVAYFRTLEQQKTVEVDVWNPVVSGIHFSWSFACKRFERGQITTTDRLECGYRNRQRPASRHSSRARSFANRRKRVGTPQSRRLFANVVFIHRSYHDVNRQMRSTTICFPLLNSICIDRLWRCTLPIQTPPLSPVDHFSFPSGLLCCKDNRMA